MLLGQVVTVPAARSKRCSSTPIPSASDTSGRRDQTGQREGDHVGVPGQAEFHGAPAPRSASTAASSVPSYAARTSASRRRKREPLTLHFIAFTSAGESPRTAP